jgi:hypothetical protein
MTRYIIAMTITPDPPTAAAASHMTVRVDTGSGQPRVNELVVRADDARGLGSADLPAIDLGLLIQALSGGMSAAPAATPTVTRANAATRANGAARPAGSRARGRRSRVATEPKRVVTKSARRRGARDDAAAERAYRRMPDASEVLEAYEQVGTITGLAAHYGVPRHTAQGWATRLRRSGYQIGRS